jgi:hypothetical protein
MPSIHQMALEKYDSVFTQFPSADARQWKEKIIAELKGADFEKLVSGNASRCFLSTQKPMPKNISSISLLKNIQAG